MAVPGIAQRNADTDHNLLDLWLVIGGAPMERATGTRLSAKRLADAAVPGLVGEIAALAGHLQLRLPMMGENRKGGRAVAAWMKQDAAPVHIRQVPDD